MEVLILSLITIIVLSLIILAVFYVKKVPHGWVQFKTGLVLKFMPPLDAKPPVELRRSLEEYVAKNAHKLKIPISKVENFQIPTRHGSIEARLYDDSSRPSDKTILFIHGGGWCICSIDTHNEQARRLAKATRMPLVSINYALAPENKFPIAHDQCADATMWLHENAQDMGLGDQLVLCGDSAGGNLVISSALETIKKGYTNSISHVIPIYPAIDGRDMSTESHQLFGTGYYLTTKAMKAFSEALLSSKDELYDPRISPILAREVSNFPSTFVLTAAFDPLRDEGEAFAEKLKNAGVPVKLKRYKNAIHGFFGLNDFGSRGLQAVNDIAVFLDSSNNQSITSS